jgi:universal stress protein E
MKAIERILVVCDPAMQESPALHRGIQLAKRSGAELQLCIFDYDSEIELAGSRVSSEVMRRAQKQFIDEKMGWLVKQAASCVESGLRVDCDAVWAPKLHEAIVAKTLESKPDLVIKDVQQQSGLKRILFLPRDWKLVRFCPAPLMLVFPGSDHLPRQIVAAVDAWEEIPDPAPLNTAVIDTSLRMGLYCDAEVHVATAFPYSPTTGRSYPPLAAAIADAERSHTQAFHELAERLQVPKNRRHLMTGEPATMLADLVTRNRTELLVMGTHFRSGWDRLFLGSTAETILNHVQCDVLLLKPAGVQAEITRQLKLPAADTVQTSSGSRSAAA